MGRGQATRVEPPRWGQCPGKRDPQSPLAPPPAWGHREATAVCTQKSLHRARPRRRPEPLPRRAPRRPRAALPPSRTPLGAGRLLGPADSQQQGGRVPSSALGRCPPLTALNFHFLSFCGAHMLGHPDAVNVVTSHGRFQSPCSVFNSVRNQFCFLLGRFRTSEELFGDPATR